MKPRTDLYAFIFGGREFQTDDPENANPENSSYIGQCECAVRHSVEMVAYILRRPTHMDFKHKHSCVVHKLFLQ